MMLNACHQAAAVLSCLTSLAYRKTIDDSDDYASKLGILHERIVKFDAEAPPAAICLDAQLLPAARAMLAA
jgi:hypothetical protein